MPTSCVELRLVIAHIPVTDFQCGVGAEANARYRHRGLSRPEAGRDGGDGERRPACGVEEEVLGVEGLILCGDQEQPGLAGRAGRGFGDRDEQRGWSL